LCLCQENFVARKTIGKVKALKPEARCRSITKYGNKTNRCRGGLDARVLRVGKDPKRPRQPINRVITIVSLFPFSQWKSVWGSSRLECHPGFYTARTYRGRTTAGVQRVGRYQAKRRLCWQWLKRVCTIRRSQMQKRGRSGEKTKKTAGMWRQHRIRKISQNK